VAHHKHLDARRSGHLPDVIWRHVLFVHIACTSPYAHLRSSSATGQLSPDAP
jgi:hypothetical protein